MGHPKVIEHINVTGYIGNMDFIGSPTNKFVLNLKTTKAAVKHISRGITCFTETKLKREIFDIMSCQKP